MTIPLRQAQDKFGMSEDTTQKNLDARSFEERVFARFDAIDARFTALKEKVAARAVETKPIWERALKEIAETRAEMKERFDDLDSKIEVLNNDVLNLRASVRRGSRLSEENIAYGEVTDPEIPGTG